MTCISRNVYCLFILTSFFQINNLFGEQHTKLMYAKYNINNHNYSAATNDGVFLIDTNIVYEPAPDSEEVPSIAFDGVNYLVVWQDNRNGEWDIYGTRVDQSGVVIDTLSIAISIDEGDQKEPSICFDGENYFVVWQDSCNGGWDIYGARVSPLGIVLEPSGFVISDAPQNQICPSVSFDSTNYLVVWQDDRNGDWDIYGARVAQSGTVLDTTGLPISNETNTQRSPSIVFGGMEYLVVWGDKRNGDYDYIYAARVSLSGTVVDSSGIFISASEDWNGNPAIAFDGTNYLVVWENFRYLYYPDVDFDIYGVRVDQSGTVIDTTEIHFTSNLWWQVHPAIMFDGINYLVVWRNGEQYYWPYPGDWRDIHGKRVSQSGVILDSIIVISDAPEGQILPAVAFDGTNYFVVWEDRRSTLSHDIFGSRVSTSGSVVDPAGIVISPTEKPV